MILRLDFDIYTRNMTLAHLLKRPDSNR